VCKIQCVKKVHTGIVVGVVLYTLAFFVQPCCVWFQCVKGASV
jgi:hypothetical protein